jgi:hypothetical protein
MRNFKMRQVLSVPFDKIDKELLSHLKEKIEEIVVYQVRISKQQIPLPNCRRRGDQLFAEDLFPLLDKPKVTTFSLHLKLPRVENSY